MRPPGHPPLSAGLGGAGPGSLILPPPPWIVGHRGAAGEALENTLESFALAVAQGATMVELDLQLTRDEQLVVFHDADLRRLGDRRLVIEQTVAATLLATPIRHPRRGTAGRLPSLAEVLTTLPPGLPLNLELKRQAADRPTFARRLAAELAAHPRPVLISSFDFELLAEVRSLAPGMALAPIAQRHPEALLAAGQRLGAFSLHCHRRMASRRLLAAARQAGLPVLVYTVNRAVTARGLLRRGVSGLFTDHPGRLRRQLASHLSNETKW